MNGYNQETQVTRGGLTVDIKETVPPFSFVVIGKSGGQTASREQHQRIVWDIAKPGLLAPLYRPELIAVSGPLPIDHHGYGTVTQDWPARVRILSENLPAVHGSVGIANDSWLAELNGGLFTVLGADPVYLTENGATQTTEGQWVNLPEHVLIWVTPRGESRPWGQGWGLTNEPPTIESLDFLLEEPLQYRLQQPYQGLSPESVRLFEPVDDASLWEPVLEEEDHEPTEAEEGLPVKRTIEWVKVREAGTYLIQFGGLVSQSDLTIVSQDYIGIGLFGAAWNEDVEEFELFDQPAAIASRYPFHLSFDIDGTIGGGYGGYEFYVETLFVRSQENIAASAIIELKAGWAFGFLKVGLPKMLCEHFYWTGHRIGPAANADTFWDANPGKIDWAGDDHSPVS